MEVIRVRQLNGALLLEVPLGSVAKVEELRERAAEALNRPDRCVVLFGAGCDPPDIMSDGASIKDEVEWLDLGDKLVVEVNAVLDEEALLKEFLEAAEAESVEALNGRNVVVRRRLGGLPSAVGALNRSRSLEAGDSELRRLPDELGNMSALEALDLRGNKLTALPSTFGKLQSLQHLVIERNLLAALPDDFGELVGLRMLFLNDNVLAALPSTFGMLRNLELLHLEFNYIEELPDTFGQLAALQDLHMSVNRLTALPDSFCSLRKLSLLDLKGNPIVRLPESFDALRELEALRIFGKHLTELPGSFSQLTTFEDVYLEVRKNRIGALAHLPLPFLQHEKYMKDEELADVSRVRTVGWVDWLYLRQRRHNRKFVVVDRNLAELLHPALEARLPSCDTDGVGSVETDNSIEAKHEKDIS